jgi:predicted amidophosphoribosyltransferase
MALDAYRQLPIPDWLELSCPQCRYLLRGLPEHRCPECGLKFDIDDLITCTTPLRPAEITPATRPVPELGLTCDTCDYPLRGLPGDRCPECGEPFDLAACIPPGAWPSVPAGGSATESQLLFHTLRAEGIPCTLEAVSETLSTLYGLTRGCALRVPRAYYLDALHVIRRREATESPPWTCPDCGEEVPGNFEVCWKCQTPRSSEPPPCDESTSLAPPP